MISKKVGISPKNDNYARLADYIADAGHKGEKSLMHWCVGCLGDDDYQSGIAEAVDAQALNTRSEKEKTYHLMISFRPEDGAKLVPEVFKAIEERFASALGYTEHQRHCGVHQNTANLHLHVAYNMVHPEKHTRHKEFRDYWIRDNLCRELEKEFDLVVDNGRDKSQSKGRLPPLTEKAALIEAHTGQQSFDSYAKGHRASILQALELATNWQDIHETLARYGMTIKPHGNGLAIKDQHGKHTIKASALDRSLSQKKVEERFGSYVAPRRMEHVAEHSRYQAEPLHRSPERGELFMKYKAAIELRKNTLQQVKEREDAALTAIQKNWAAKRQEIDHMSIAKRNRRNLLQLVNKHEAEALVKARIPFQEQRIELRKDIPFTSWNSFLRHESEQGNEVALAILRSREAVVEAEVPASSFARNSFNAVGTALYVTKERELLERTDISSNGKKSLLAVLRMEKLIGKRPAQSSKDYTWQVDNKGIVIFTFANGGIVRDTGQKVLFSVGNAETAEIARLYGQAKWGKNVCMENNKIFWKKIQERQQGWSR